MQLKDILCQGRAIAALERAYLAGRAAGSYIFAGQEGVGKFSTATAWAKLLFCKKPTVDKSGKFADSCGRCSSCVAYEAGSHPDNNVVYKELREFTRDGKNKAAPVEMPIDVVREFLVEKVAVRPLLSERKVFIVREAEKLNDSSQNALLKVLEEPPTYCTIILLCTRMEQLLPTTKSRCQIVQFGPIDEQVVAKELEKLGVENRKALVMARLAGGSLGTAKQWQELARAGADIFNLRREVVSRLASYSYEQSIDMAARLLEEGKGLAEAWEGVEEKVSKTDIGRRATKVVLRIMTAAFADAMKLPLVGKDGIINFDQAEEIEKIAKRFGPEGAAERIFDCQQAQRQLEDNVNEKLIFERLLLKIATSDNIA